MFLKRFEIKHELNFVIPINGTYEINSCHNELGFGEGPTYETSWLIDCVIDLLIMRVWPILFIDMRLIIFVYCSLTMFHDSAFVIAAQVRIYSYFALSLYMFCFSYCAWSIWVFIDSLIDCHVSFISLVETRLRDLEGCYGFYRTFPISNLTPEPDPVFHRPTFFQNKESHLGFFFLILFTL